MYQHLSPHNIKIQMTIIIETKIVETPKQHQLLSSLKPSCTVLNPKTDQKDLSDHRPVLVTFNEGKERRAGTHHIPKWILDCPRTKVMINKIAALILQTNLPPLVKLSYFKMKVKEYLVDRLKVERRRHRTLTTLSRSISIPDNLAEQISNLIKHRHEAVIARCQINQLPTSHLPNQHLTSILKSQRKQEDQRPG